MKDVIAKLCKWVAENLAYLCIGMRLFSFILSFYVLALSIVPCSDGIEQDMNDVKTEISKENHDHDHSHHNDFCTPFCTCYCCGSFFTLPIGYCIGEAEAPVFITYLFSYKFDYSFNYYEGVWHPPTIS